MFSLASNNKIEIFIYVLLLRRDIMAKITLDLGKGVELTAPIKLRMTADEWRRMTDYIDAIINQQEVER